MALVRCPECDTQISDKAAACIKCGAPVDLTKIREKKSNELLGWSVIGGIAIVIFIVYRLTTDSKPEKPWTPQVVLSPQEQAEKDRAEVRVGVAYACRDFVKRSLRDPESAQFDGRNADVPVTTQADGTFVALIKVRANNGFGGKNAAIFSCTLQLDAGTYRLAALKEIR